jgi:hypothetical protein
MMKVKRARRRAQQQPRGDQSNAEWLYEWIRASGDTRAAVAAQLGVSRATLNAWLAPLGAPSHRMMPDHMLELAQLKLSRIARGRAAISTPFGITHSP